MYQVTLKFIKTGCTWILIHQVLKKYKSRNLIKVTER